MDAFSSAFGAHIRAMRLRQGLSQEEFAHRAGLHTAERDPNSNTSILIIACERRRDAQNRTILCDSPMLDEGACCGSVLQFDRLDKLTRGLTSVGFE